MAIFEAFFSKEIIEELEKKKIKYFKDFHIFIKNIQKRPLNFKNLMIKSIYTSANYNADNPSRKVNLECKSKTILGNSGVGKTTFFDHLIHPLIAPFEIESPIKGYVTGLKIKYYCEEENQDYQFVFKTTHPKLREVNLNNISEEKILSHIGIYNNKETAYSFISGQLDYLNLFVNFNGIVSRYKHFFFNQQDYKVMKKFDEYIEISKHDFHRIKSFVDSNKYRIKKYKEKIDKNLKDIENINNLIKHKDKVMEFLSTYKKNEEEKKIFQKIKEINIDLNTIKEKLKIDKQVQKDWQDRKIQQHYSKKKLAFLREYYSSSTTDCHICNSTLTFENFRNNLDKEKCYLCKSPFSGYENFEDFIALEEILSKEKNYQQRSIINYQYDLPILKKKKEELILDLKKIKQKYSEPEQEIRMIITPFYKHLISEHRDLHDYLKTQDILHQNLIQENEDLLGKIQDYKKHNEESEQSYNEIASNLDYIQNLKKNFSDELEEDSNNTYSLFCEKITEYWTKLSKIKDKEIIVKNDQLYVYSTSRKKASKSAKITSLSHKQKRLSRSQIELLRYSIQLALIMGIYSKFQVLPIKAIIIDDPNSKYVPELIDLLDSEFIQKWGFQILILTNINVVYPWDIKKFDPYIGNLDIFTTNHQIEKDKWKAENE